MSTKCLRLGWSQVSTAGLDTDNHLGQDAGHKCLRLVTSVYGWSGRLGQDTDNQVVNLVIVTVDEVVEIATH